ncbi:MAG: right-handed parallel beta-helix repeat-containing protein [candidate division WOR-3 bacterium]|nr:MAG: right-handed parallel beta-helix repeat-containing protein [candidate division WOR-3 bacterium]
MKRRCCMAIVVAVFSLCSSMQAVTWYVHPDSTLNTIQAGLDSCAFNDTVLVGPGTYYENIIWPNTSSVKLISEYGPETTIVDGDSISRVIEISTGADMATVIDGFTIRHGYAGFGGGILCDNSSSPTITNNTITENLAPNGGGGIAALNLSNPIITANVISNNATNNSGGGIRCYNYPTITGNIITGNSALGTGGGIRCDGIEPVIRDNIITYNTANQSGGGIGLIHSSCTPTLVSNYIAYNVSANGGGIACLDGAFPTIDSCVILSNEGNGLHITGQANATINRCNICDNGGYGVNCMNSGVTVDAENNWWGDDGGPYHPITNPFGLGDTVSDYVDFEPWLVGPGIEQHPSVKPVDTHENVTATIFRGPLQLPTGNECRVFDITGRVVEPGAIQPGVYFLEIDNRVVQKMIIIR